MRVEGAEGVGEPPRVVVQAATRRLEHGQAEVRPLAVEPRHRVRLGRESQRLDGLDLIGDQGLVASTGEQYARRVRRIDVVGEHPAERLIHPRSGLFVSGPLGGELPDQVVQAVARLAVSGPGLRHQVRAEQAVQGLA